MTETSSFQSINVGSVPNDGTGDNLREAFIKVSDNFANITNVGFNVGNIKVTGFANVAGNLNVNGSINVVGGINYLYSNVVSNVTNYTTLAITSPTDSTSTGTGALTVSGGVGIVKNVVVGANITAGNVNSNFYGNVTGTILTINQPNITSLGNLTSLSTSGTISAIGQVRANSGISSTSVTTGALTVIGGVGISGNLYLGAGLGASNGLGTNGQFLVSSGSGVSWSNPPSYTTLIYGTSSVVASANYVNIAIASSNIGLFSATGLTVIGNITASTGNIIGTLQTAGQPYVTSLGNLTSLSANGTIQTTGVVWGNSGVGGTLLTAAQTNITSLGNLTSLSASGTIQTTGVVWGNSGVGGTLLTAAQTNITSLGNLTSLSASGTIQTTGVVWGNSGVGGTLLTAAQTNITSLGNLTSLSASGTISAIGQVRANSGISSTSVTTGALTVIGGVGISGNINAGGSLTVAGNINAGYIVGNVIGNIQTVITSVGTLANLSVTGNIDAGNVNATYLKGTLLTTSQPYITGVGTLTNLTVADTITVNSNNNVTAIINGGGTGIGNIGSSTSGFNTIFAKATTAQYADLAEKYLADAEYAPGTVVIVGGLAEVTASQFGYRAIGVVSTNPAYMMNSELDGGTYIALKGRVPVNVIGTVKKGDRLVAANNGVAQSLNKVIPADLVFAIALEDNNNGLIDVIEAIII